MPEVSPEKIGFVVTGGIGDAILCLPLIKKFEEKFSAQVKVLCFDSNLPPVLRLFGNEVKCYDCGSTVSFDDIKILLSGCGLIVWNRFESDNDGMTNHFYSLLGRYDDVPIKMRELYLKNISNQFGRNICNLKKEVLNGLIFKFSNEENYYADWERYGIDISYDELNINIPEEIVNKYEDGIKKIGKFCIVHDSRIFSNQQSIKSWYEERWCQVVDYLKNINYQVISFHSLKEKPFTGTLSCFNLMDENFSFFDFLYLLSKCSIYVGTDSWPGHAAVFLKGPKFIILKGAVARRWDHFGRYATIIRKGNCQACEFGSLYQCIWKHGTRDCMKNILVDDVIKEIDNIINK